MNSSDLDDFLKGDLSAKDFATKIANEVAGYAVLVKKKGASNPIYFYEDRDIAIGMSSITKLLSETLQGNITNIVLAYICDALTLEEQVSFESDNVKHMIFELADPEINGGFKTHDELSSILEEVRVRQEA